MGGEALLNGRFEILGSLGAGAQGETLVARDGQTGREVAIKRFFVRGASSWKDVELAEREAQVLQRISHGNLPRYVTHFEEAGALCLVTERIEGESLAQRLQRGRTLEPNEVLRFLADAQAALAYLHGLSPPLVHRDIKPSNVLCRPDGSFAIVDFGSVQHRLRAGGGSTVAGTFGFMAPEQLQGRAGPESDVYAAAATAVTAMTGLEPEDLPHRGLERDLDKALPNCDRRLRRALQAMLESNPERRPTSIQAALEAEALDQATAAGPLAARRRWLPGLLVGTGIVAAAAGGWLWHLGALRPPATASAAPVELDDWSRAELAFQAGDVADAGRIFQKARAHDPAHTISLREAEAVSIADPTHAGPVMERLKQTWFQAPSGQAQEALDCLSDKLARDLPMQGHSPPLCFMPSLQRRQWARRESTHDNPAYALHDPTGYVRFWPIYEGSEFMQDWGSAFASLEPLVKANGAADSGVRRALFAAMAGDQQLLNLELSQLDELVTALKAMLARRGAGQLETPEPADTSRSSAELVTERETARFDAERALSVAAAAAWFGHQSERAKAYLPYAESHSRAILYEHLAMVSGEQKDDPHPAESPGDYTVIDMGIFFSLRNEPPAETMKRMKAVGYSEPARLFAMFGSGRYPEARKAFAGWVAAGFVPASPNGGVVELFERSFRRREAARLVGNAALEAEQLAITRKLGRLLRDARSYAAIMSLESLLAKEM